MKISRIKLKLFTITACMVSVCTTFADELLLQLLLENNIINEQQKGVILQEYKRRKAAQAPSIPPASTPSNGQVIVLPKEKAVKKLTISGRLQPQLDILSTDVDDNDGSGEDTSENVRFHMRRVQLGAKAELGNGWKGELVTEFGGGGSGLDKAKIGKKFNDHLTLEAGFQKVPFGIEETTSSAKIKAIERSASNRFFAEGGGGLNVGARHTGIFANGDIGAGFSYAAAIANPDRGGGDRSSKDTNSLGYFGRLDHTSKWGENGKLRAGVDLAYLPEGNDANSGMNNSPITAYGLHAEYSNKRFGLLAELLGAQVENGSATGDADLYGILIQPSFFLTENLEAVVKYSHVDSDGHGLRTRDLIRRAPSSGNFYNELTSWFIGANYYFEGNAVKLSAGYEFGEAEGELSGAQGPKLLVGDEEEVQGFRARLQLLF